MISCLCTLYPTKIKRPLTNHYVWEEGGVRGGGGDMEAANAQLKVLNHKIIPNAIPF